MPTWPAEHPPKSPSRSSAPRRSPPPWPGPAGADRGRHPRTRLAVLADYAPRYAVVAKLARVRFSPAYGDELTVVDEVPGDRTTGFGAPNKRAATDARDAHARPRRRRRCACSRQSWAELDRLAVEAPEQLRKGPRGGGRDRDKVVAARHRGRAVLRPQGRGAPPAVPRRRGRPVGVPRRADDRAACRAWRRAVRRAGRPATSCAERPGTCSTTSGRSRTRAPSAGVIRAAGRPGRWDPGPPCPTDEPPQRRSLRHRVAGLRVDVTPLRTSRDFRLLFSAGTVFYLGGDGQLRRAALPALPADRLELRGRRDGSGRAGAAHRVRAVRRRAGRPRRPPHACWC